MAHLKVFESVAYAQFSDEKCAKLDTKSKKLIFIDYDKKSKVYNLYDSITKKIHVNCDVQVNKEGIRIGVPWRSTRRQMNYTYYVFWRTTFEQAINDKKCQTAMEVARNARKKIISLKRVVGNSKLNY